MVSSIAQRRALKEARRRKVLARKRRQDRGTARAEMVDLGRRWSRGALHSCLVQEAIFDHGLGIVALTREVGIGDVATAIFLVDVYCRGVKDASLQCVGRHQLNYLLGRIGSVAPWRETDPSYARKLLREAVAYADSFGFKPHPDFAGAEALFGDVVADDCDAAFRFGREGKPCYISSASESPHKIRKTLRQLSDRLGPDGFTYIVPAGDLDELWDERWSDERVEEELPF
jgi:hypothetical protein